MFLSWILFWAGIFIAGNFVHGLFTKFLRHWGFKGVILSKLDNVFHERQSNSSKKGLKKGLDEFINLYQGRLSRLSLIGATLLVVLSFLFCCIGEFKKELLANDLLYSYFGKEMGQIKYWVLDFIWSVVLSSLLLLPFLLRLKEKLHVVLGVYCFFILLFGAMVLFSPYVLLVVFVLISLLRRDFVYPLFLKRRTTDIYYLVITSIVLLIIAVLYQTRFYLSSYFYVLIVSAITPLLLLLNLLLSWISLLKIRRRVVLMMEELGDVFGFLDKTEDVSRGVINFVIVLT